MTHTRYKICGIHIDSPIPLAALECAEASSRTTRVDFGDERAVPVAEPAGTPMALFVDRHRGYSLVRNERGYLLRVFGVCDFSISADLTTAQLSMSPALGREFASICLGGTLVSGLALIRAQPVLHAGAVLHEGRALALAGGSGSGKSTLLTALCAEGAKLLVDDALRIEKRGTQIWGYSGSHELRLRPRSLSVAERIPDAAVRPTADARYGVQAASAGVDAARLDAVLIPEPDRVVTTTELTRLSPQDALARLLALPRLPGCVDPEGQRAMFSTVAELSRRVPVAIARVPWGPPFSKHLGRDLLKHVTNLVAESST